MKAVALVALLAFVGLILCGCMLTNLEPEASLEVTGVSVEKVGTNQYRVPIGDQVTFDASDSFDPDGTVDAYHFWLNRGPQGWEPQGWQKSPYFDFVVVGEAIIGVRVEVEDNRGENSCSDCTTVELAPYAPAPIPVPVPDPIPDPKPCPDCPVPSPPEPEPECDYKGPLRYGLRMDGSSDEILPDATVVKGTEHSFVPYAVDENGATIPNVSRYMATVLRFVVADGKIPAHYKEVKTYELDLENPYFVSSDFTEEGDYKIRFYVSYLDCKGCHPTMPVKEYTIQVVE